MSDATEDKFEVSSQDIADESALVEEASRLQRQLDLQTGDVPGVYVVAANGRFKVGRAARSMLQRVRNLQCGCPDELDFLAILSLNPDDEREAHAALHAFRERGEWFTMNDASLQALLDLQTKFIAEGRWDT